MILNAITRQMKIKSKIWLDTNLGYVLLYLLAQVVRVAKVLLHKEDANDSIEFPKVVLITKFQGMGSLVLAAKAISVFREANPNAKIIFWGTSSTTLLAALMPEFDEVLILEDKNISVAFKSLLSNLKYLRSQNVDVSFDLEVYSNLAALFGFFVSAKKRFGFMLSSASLRRFVYSDLVYFNRYSFLGLTYRQLFYISNPLAFESTQLNGSEVYDKWNLDKVELPYKLSSKFVLVNIHTSDLSFERKWSVDNYSRWIEKFINEMEEMNVILTGAGANEIEETKKIFKHSRILNWAGMLSVAQLIKCINEAELVISADSGPLHIARVLGKKNVGIFGPTRVENYVLEGDSNTISVRQPIYCSPCVHHWDRPPCSGDNVCMKKIKWWDVWNASSDLLGLSKFTDSEKSQLIEKSLTSSSMGSYFPGRFYPD